MNADITWLWNRAVNKFRLGSTLLLGKIFGFIIVCSFVRCGTKLICGYASFLRRLNFPIFDVKIFS